MGFKSFQQMNSSYLFIYFSKQSDFQFFFSLSPLPDFVSCMILMTTPMRVCNLSLTWTIGPTTFISLIQAVLIRKNNSISRLWKQFIFFTYYDLIMTLVLFFDNIVVLKSSLLRPLFTFLVGLGPLVAIGITMPFKVGE